MNTRLKRSRPKGFRPREPVGGDHHVTGVDLKIVPGRAGKGYRDLGDMTKIVLTFLAAWIVTEWLDAGQWRCPLSEERSKSLEAPET
ncbi:hypothetical protein ACFV0L_28995 [Streptosporangium canum]|uniref:hypothetical protein n=1 Tax=Streptosporangium canum TaxID=324952 RepID=UPI0036A58232